MVGDDPNVVAQILAFHPDLIPAAVAATKARTDRRRVGTALIVSGFSALGVGLIGGLLEALSAPLLCFDDACRERQSHAESAGKTIAIAGAAAGMALAIPGFIRSAVASSAETDAIRKYRQWNPERLLPPPREPPRYSGPGSAPRSVNLPLLSLTF